MRSFFKTMVCSMLMFATAFNFYGCTTVRASDLMDGIVPNEVLVASDLGDKNAAVADFAARLFAASAKDGENTLISPLSVLCALAMTANGADGETLKQMEEVLGLSADELNLYVFSYIRNLPEGEKHKLALANSIWFKDDNRFEVSTDFLQTNADYYGAEIYKAPFDNVTLDEINGWVKENTDGMIPKILDELSKDTIMCLINALAFEAEWSEIYEDNKVRDGKFTKENGDVQNVEFMYSTENEYIADENATGFIKYYSGGKYAFAALLPDEGVSVADYVKSLDGEGIQRMLENPNRASVKVAIPKFETAYDVEMSEILSRMGMPIAFDELKADFSELGEYRGGNIYISKVIHKTYISVGEKGTKAGAATAVVLEKTMSVFVDEIKEVYLDRPFVYMLIDCENNIPFFIGTMMDIEK